MAKAGDIIIGTSLENKKLEKQLAKLENKLKDEELKLEIKATGVEEAKRDLEDIQNELKKTIEARNKLNIEIAKKQKQFSALDARVNAGEVLDKDEKIRYQNLQTYLNEIDVKQKEINDEVDEYNAKYEKVLNKLTKAESSYDIQYRKVSQIRKELEQTKKINFSKILNDANNSLGKIVKKVAKWGLAVFGVRSAYLAIRQAMSILSQYDTQLAEDLQFIRSALAYTIEPIVKYIVELMKTLLTYLAYIVRMWTGRDIFEKASKSLKSASKSAKEINKSLAGFDEANVLSGFSASDDATGGLPSVSTINGNVPKWIEWIAQNGDKVKAILFAIAEGLIAIKFGFDLIQGAGLTIFLIEVYNFIQAILTFLKNPTWQNFIKILEHLALAVAGVALMFHAWPVAIGAVIAFVILKLLECRDKVIGFLQSILHFMEGTFLKKVHELFGPVGDILVMPFVLAVSLIESLFRNLSSGIKKIVQGIIQIFTVDFKTGIKTAFSGLQDILETPFRGLIDMINSVIRGINNITGKSIPLIRFNKSTGGGGYRAKGGIYYPKLAMGGIINQPGKGVPYHGATIGERGAEAVVPLTDSQQMALLGEAIGKYITINANIVNTMNGRVISKELQKVQNDSDFAYNR